MEWVEQIKKGMELIGNGCRYQSSFNCKAICPFKNYCNELLKAKRIGEDLLYPSQWGL